MSKFNLMMGDCLERMKEIPEKSVDMVLTDPPYGTTACKWDSVIDFKLMWKELNRLAKNEKSVVVLFGSEPFSSALRMSNIKEFKYDWVWQKNAGSNFATTKYQPMKEHEMVSVFCPTSSFYYPVLQKRAASGLERIKTPIKTNTTPSEVYNMPASNGAGLKREALRCPSSVQKFNRERGLHPTQKPVALLEYLVKTYTLENETVLDFTMGSGSTGVACKNLNRNFIGIERDEKYFEIAKNRIENA